MLQLQSKFSPFREALCHPLAAPHALTSRNVTADDAPWLILIKWVLLVRHLLFLSLMITFKTPALDHLPKESVVRDSGGSIALCGKVHIVDM